MFIPFTQRGDDKTGVGPSPPILRESARADEGSLVVRNSPSQWSVFTILLLLGLQRENSLPLAENYRPRNPVMSNRKAVFSQKRVLD